MAAATLDSVLWHGSLAVLAIAVLPLGSWLPIPIHPIIRYALGATALVVLLFFMGDDDEGVPVVTMETNTPTAGRAGGNGVWDVAGQPGDESREARREHLKEEIRRKILNDAYRDVQRVSSAGAVPPHTSRDDDDDDDDDTSREVTGAKAAENQAGDANDEGRNNEEEGDEDDFGTTNNNTWRCACENGFLPPGLLKTFGGAEAVMRMGMGQCYHKGGYDGTRLGFTKSTLTFLQESQFNIDPASFLSMIVSIPRKPGTLKHLRDWVQLMSSDLFLLGPK